MAKPLIILLMFLQKQHVGPFAPNNSSIYHHGIKHEQDGLMNSTTNRITCHNAPIQKLYKPEQQIKHSYFKMLPRSILLLLALVVSTVTSFGVVPKTHSVNSRSSSSLPAESETAQESTATISVDPKEAVKVFGRLAEKYIMLDASAGMCCYSGCKDCEFRLPDGGYRMADQSAARPKWIPNYETRAANGKEHTTKWSAELFSDESLTRDEFVAQLKELPYAPTLGGPFLAASAATIEDDTAAQVLFDALVVDNSGDNDDDDNVGGVLTKHTMSVRLKELADGEEGLGWGAFSKIMGL